MNSGVAGTVNVLAKKRACLALLIIILLISLIGCAGDPLSGDVYFTDIHADSVTYTGNYWDEMATPANAVGEGWPAPPAANAQSGYVYLFADQPLAVNEVFVHFTVTMPHNWKEGTDIIPNVRWIANSDQIGTSVRWRIDYSWANIDDDFPVSSHLWVVSAPSNNDSLKHQKTDFATISGAGKNIGSTIMYYLSRNSSDVSDNFTDTAIFVSANILYQVDSPGSTSAWIK